MIHWRKEHDKIGFEHETPLTDAALAALETARQSQAAIGEAWVFPDPLDAAEPVHRLRWWQWWDLGERLAGLERVRGRGWHSFRRKFATEMKATPLKDLCYLGGWKEPRTLLRCYQRPDEETMREAFTRRLRLRSGG